MISRKSDKADLEGKRIIFLEAGFVFALVVCLIMFEWKSPARAVTEFVDILEMEFEEEVIPVTRQERERPPMEQAIILPRDELHKTEGKQTGPSIMRIVDDGSEITDELVVGDQEADQSTEVATIDIDDVILEEEVEEEEIFFIVEQMPTFNGGDLKEFQKYVQKNLQYPEKAKQNDVQGTVIIQFVVNREGKVVKAKVVRSVNPELDEEALRVVNSSPKWTPGQQRNMPASVAFTLPVMFIIADLIP